MHVSLAIHQYGQHMVKGEALPQPIFAPPWIHPLEYLAETTTRMVAFQVFLAFCL